MEKTILKLRHSGFSLIEVLISALIVAVTSIGTIHTLQGVNQIDEANDQALEMSNDLINLKNLILSGGDEYRGVPLGARTCAQAEEVASSFQEWCGTARKESKEQLNIKRVLTDSSHYSSKVSSINIQKADIINTSVLITPDKLSIPTDDSNSQQLPTRGYRIKHWNSSTAERFKGRYFGAPSLPQYKIFRTWYKQEMIAETEDLEPRYEDGSLLNIYKNSRDGFTIICDPEIGPCDMYEAGPDLIEYVSSGECGSACM